MNRVRVCLGAIVAVLAGCSTGSGINLPDGGIKLGDCEVSFDDLKKADDISDACRDFVNNLLPKPENNVKGRLYALGSESGGGTRAVFVSGVDAQGTPLELGAPQGDGGVPEAGAGFLTVSVVKGGITTDLAADAYTVVTVDGLASGAFATSFITDYSASMTEQDISDASAIYTAAVDILPPIYEAEVTLFSTEVSRKLAFSTQKQDILAALAVDKAFKRKSTALYDGLGTAVTSLNARPAPVKILLATTDGQENASKEYKTKESVIALIDQGGVFVVMLGGLFADQGDLRALAGPRGIFAYARAVRPAAEAIRAFVNSLGKAVRVEVKPPNDDADEVIVKADGYEARFPK